MTDANRKILDRITIMRGMVSQMRATASDIYAQYYRDGQAEALDEVLTIIKEHGESESGDCECCQRIETILQACDGYDESLTLDANIREVIEGTAEIARHSAAEIASLRCEMEGDPRQ